MGQIKYRPTRIRPTATSTKPYDEVAETRFYILNKCKLMHGKIPNHLAITDSDVFLTREEAEAARALKQTPPMWILVDRDEKTVT